MWCFQHIGWGFNCYQVVCLEVKKMKKKLSLIIVVLLALVLTFATACGGNTATDTGTSTDTGTTAGTDTGTGTTSGGGDTYIIRTGAGTGADNPMMTFMERFKEYAERESGGQIVVEIYPFGQLGTNAQMIQAVSDGSVEMYMLPSNYWGSMIPEINAITLPGLFDDSAHAIRGLQADTENMFEPLFNDKGVSCLGYCFLNDYIWATNIDLSGGVEKMRAQRIWSNPGAAYAGMLEAMGATPSLVDVSEMVSGIQNGTLDGASGGMSLFKPFNIQSVCDYLYMGPRNVGVFPVMVNLNWFNSLPADIRDIIAEGSRIVCYEGFDSYNSIYEYGAEYQIEAVELARADGMTIIEPSAADWELLSGVMESVTEKSLQDLAVQQPYYDKLLPLAAATKK